MKFMLCLKKGVRKSVAASEKYKELIEKLEKLSKILISVTKYSVIGNSISALLTTTTNYFVAKMEDESYYLPFPIMYVLWKTDLSKCEQKKQFFDLIFL